LQAEGYIELNEGKLHYLRIGNGKKIIVAFPGYGNEAVIFAAFEKFLPEYTIISINLPYHGKSDWPLNSPLQKRSLTELINKLMIETGVDKVILAGYSIGARLCLCIIEQMPESISDVLLIAPDGLVPNRFYHFVTMNAFGKWLFKDFLTQPKKYMPLVTGMRSAGIVNEGRYRFATHYIDSDASRGFLLKVWPNLRFIVPDRNKLKEAINKYKIPVHIFIGNRDKVILAKYGERFKKEMSTVKLYIVDRGHWLLDDETLSAMAKHLST